MNISNVSINVSIASTHVSLSEMDRSQKPLNFQATITHQEAGKDVKHDL